MTTKVALMMCGLTDKAKSANKSQVKMLLERDSEIDIFVAAVKPVNSPKLSSYPKNPIAAADPV